VRSTGEAEQTLALFRLREAKPKQGSDYDWGIKSNKAILLKGSSDGLFTTLELVFRPKTRSELMDYEHAVSS
jgi:hypothetical protein